MASAHDAGEPPRTGIVFTDDALDDLRRLGRDVARRALLKLGLLLADPFAGYPLRDELTGYRKLVVGDNTWRIVYRVDDSKAIIICEIWAIGPRADGEVYREVAARIARFRDSSPHLVPLADIVERLGHHARGLTALLESLGRRAALIPELPEVVPTWLAERLERTVGMRLEEVAALGLQEAIAIWEAFLRGDR